jgi:hypothetical protein
LYNALKTYSFGIFLLDLVVTRIPFVLKHFHQEGTSIIQLPYSSSSRMMIHDGRIIIHKNTHMSAMRRMKSSTHKSLICRILSSDQVASELHKLQFLPKRQLFANHMDGIDDWKRVSIHAYKHLLNPGNKGTLLITTTTKLHNCT